MSVLSAQAEPSGARASGTQLQPDGAAVRTPHSVAMETVVGFRDKPSESPWAQKKMTFES